MGGWIKIKFIFPAMQFDITIHNSTADLVLPLTQCRTIVASALRSAAPLSGVEHPDIFRRVRLVTEDSRYSDIAKLQAKHQKHNRYSRNTKKSSRSNMNFDQDPWLPGNHIAPKNCGNVARLPAYTSNGHLPCYRHCHCH